MSPHFTMAETMNLIPLPFYGRIKCVCEGGEVVVFKRCFSVSISEKRRFCVQGLET